MSFFYNMSIRSKLFLIFIIPSVALLFLILFSVSSKMAIVNEGQVLKNGLELSVKISSLVHEIQKERGATAGFLSSKGTKFVETLSNQKKSTDIKRVDIQDAMNGLELNALPKKFVENLNSALAVFNNIQNIREQV